MLLRLAITRYHRITTVVYCRQNFISVNVCMCVCVYVYVYICMHYYKNMLLNIINWHFKQIIINELWLHNQQTKQNENKKTNKKNQWWDLISSAGEPEQKWMYWNLWNSCSGHQPMSFTLESLCLIGLFIFSFKMLN